MKEWFGLSVVRFDIKTSSTLSRVEVLDYLKNTETPQNFC